MIQINIEIVNSTAKHSRDIIPLLREDDRKEALAMGLDPDKAVFNVYRRSVYRKTALVDGKIAAMWGVCGVPLSTKGYPWFVTTDLVESISPATFIKIYKQEVNQFLQIFSVLEGCVDATYHTAVRVLRLVGFDVSKPFQLNNNLFRQFTLSI